MEDGSDCLKMSCLGIPKNDREDELITSLEAAMSVLVGKADSIEELLFASRLGLVIFCDGADVVISQVFSGDVHHLTPALLVPE